MLPCLVSWSPLPQLQGPKTKVVVVVLRLACQLARLVCEEVLVHDELVEGEHAEVDVRRDRPVAEDVRHGELPPHGFEALGDRQVLDRRNVGQLKSIIVFELLNQCRIDGDVRFVGEDAMRVADRLTLYNRERCSLLETSSG